MNRFSLALRSLRIRENLTQDELADSLNIAKSTISMYETGNRTPDFEMLEVIADFFNVDMNFLLSGSLENTNSKGGRRINVYGTIPAGVPLEAVTDIIDWEEIPSSWQGDYLALQVKGDSMEPEYKEGDVIIVKQQPDCESGQDCVVYVNGYDATLKRIVKQQTCIMLQPLNAAYEPKVYDYSDEDGVTILGVVVEMRRKKG